MSTILNDRDALLQATSPRLTAPEAGALLVLSSDSLVFHVDTEGAAAPGVITLTAALLNLAGYADKVVFTSSIGATLTGTGLSRRLAYADMRVPQAKITASVLHESGVELAMSVTINKVQDGLRGPAGASALTNAVLYAYQRAAQAPTGSPGNVTYGFASAAIIAPAGDALENGWRKSIPPGKGPLYVTAASASGVGSSDTIAAAEWAAAVLLAESGEAGAPGAPGANGANGAPGTNGFSSATLTIYKRQQGTAPPATPTGVASYAFSPPLLSGLTGGWSASVPPVGAGAYLFVSTATAVSMTATDNIEPAEWAAAQLLAADGAIGPQGKSARIAFTLINGFSLAASPGSVLLDGDVRPPAGTWGETRAWQANIDAAPSPGQAWFQSSGMYDPVTNRTMWTTPYMSSLKVGQLSAISADLGAVNAGSININGRFVVDVSGGVTIRGNDGLAGHVITSDATRVYDERGVLRVNLGRLL